MPRRLPTSSPGQIRPLPKSLVWPGKTRQRIPLFAQKTGLQRILREMCTIVSIISIGIIAANDRLKNWYETLGLSPLKQKHLTICPLMSCSCSTHSMISRGGIRPGRQRERNLPWNLQKKCWYPGNFQRLESRYWNRQDLNWRYGQKTGPCIHQNSLISH